MRQYECFELALKGAEPEGSWTQVDLQAEFVCEGNIRRVEGFYAGDGVYKVRFYPDRAGRYSWKVTGALNTRGEEMCMAAEMDRREEIRRTTASHPGRETCRTTGTGQGIVRVEGMHFRYDNGTWYRPFGTTVYALAHQEKALVDTTMETLRGAPFNKVRFCVFPKHYDFNHNEPPYFPFEKKEGGWDVHRPNFAFWEALEGRIRELDAMGIQGDLILFHPYDRWGFSELGKEDSLVYLDYLLRRLSAMPNLWWSLANEYDLMPGYSHKDWEDFAGFVAKHDPYGHCLSNHNCMAYWDFSQKEITHCSIQDVNVSEVPELWEQYGKPVIFDECRYEGNIIHSWGNLSAREMTRRFWTATCCGGYCTHGETYYSEDEVLWWAKGGTLKGESPARIAFLREIVESLPGPLDFMGEGLGAFTETQLQTMQEQGPSEEFRENFFLMAMLELPRERLRSFLVKERVALGHCGQEAYLKYLERQSASVTELSLPQNGSYRVEVIDTWNMTRTVAAKNVCGKVRVNLPGREDMAVLALRQ